MPPITRVETVTAPFFAAVGYPAPASRRAPTPSEPRAADGERPNPARRPRPGSARAGWITAALVIVLAASAPPSAPLAPAAEAAEAGAATAQSDSSAVLVTASGRHRFTIDVADTPATRARGLMERTGIAPDYGMLFDFGADQPVSFWMKNTPTPLDMIFIRADGTVAGIAADTTPYSLETIDSPAPVRFVLEVVAGTARRIGLVPGNRMEQARVAAP